MRASALAAAALVACAAASPLGGPSRGILSGLQHAAMDALTRVRVPPPVLGSGHKSAPSRIAFHNPAVNQFYVDGTKIPDVSWDAGASYAGLLPISNKTGENRKLYFWFFPPGPQGSTDDLVIWLNGGPGCSSLEGLLQENGPISWQFGQAAPTQNPYSWTNLSSVLWIDSPLGTGWSAGAPAAANEHDVSAQLVGFLQQFLGVFNEMKGKNLYLTGESYAGMYIPYLANYIYDTPSLLDMHLQGLWLGSPALSWDVFMSEVPVLAFVEQYASLFSFDPTFMASLSATAQRCGYSSYMSTHVTYPPKGPLPLPGSSVEFDNGCDIWSDVANQALAINPAFNIYNVFNTFPVPWDVLGDPGTYPAQQSPIYFARPDVAAALHAPPGVVWAECTGPAAVFVNGTDGSQNSAFDAFPRAIERSPRGAVVMAGLADFNLLAGGQRIIIQNMTWGGKQGFQSPIGAFNFMVDGFPAALGNVHSERGLTYYEVALAGHMVPQFSPWSAYQGMQYLMNKRNTP